MLRRVLVCTGMASFALASWPASGLADTVTYTTVGQHNWTVPARVFSATFDVYGAQGGAGYTGGGGLGGRATVTLAVTPGQVFQVNVGGTGGVNGAGGMGGGGQGGGPTGNGGGGGGASDVRDGSFALTERVLVAGGGGGGGNSSSGPTVSNGGAGGGIAGEAGSMQGGQGGTQTGGGAGAGGGGAGDFPTGGAGTCSSFECGGGGGGGWYGGGGGVDSGGGGAGYGPSGVSFETGTRAADGQGIVTFIATPFPPAAVTGSASSVTTTEALLAGSVNPNGTAATYHFEYGTSTAYGASTPEYSAGSDSSPHNENQAVAGLTAGATYHFRIVGTSGSGTTAGSDATFTTTAPASTPAPQPDPAQQPGATTAAATGIGQHASTLNGALDSHGAEATYHFDYGPTSAYGFRTADSTLAGAAPAAVVAQLTGLEQGNVVHFRLVAINSGGTTTGADSSFTTLGRLKPSLTIKVGGRDRTFPYTYAVTGRVLLPNGVSASDGCSGSVAIQVMSGKRPIATMRTPVTKSCTYKRKVTLRSRSRLPITHGKLRVLSHFSGNHALLGGFSKHASARFGI